MIVAFQGSSWLPPLLVSAMHIYIYTMLIKSSYQITNPHIYILQTIIEQAFMETGFLCDDTSFNRLIRLKPFPSSLMTL